MKNSGSSLRIGFVGDIGLGPDHDDLIKKYGTHYLLDEVRSLLSSVDLVIGNLECSIISSDASGITPSNLYASPLALQCLKEQSNLHICLANNHIADFGEHGVRSTMQNLEKLGIPHFGAGVNYTKAIAPHIIRIDGITIGLICASDFSYSNASKDLAGSAPLDKKRLIRQIKELKMSCQYVIVILHADEEFQDFPAPYRIRLSRYLIDVGADAIVQHHPHVVQGVEIYKGGTIAYSLGNWAFKIGDYQAPYIQTKFGAFFVLELPIDRLTKIDENKRYNITHTKIDEMHRPVQLARSEVADQQARFDKLSELLLNARHLRENWHNACKKSIVKEIMNAYYMLRRSGLSVFINRIKHLVSEPLFRRQLLGLITFGYY